MTHVHCLTVARHPVMSLPRPLPTGPVDAITSVTSPNIPIAEATASTVESLRVEWSQTSPDAAKTASYRLFRQSVGAASPTEVCGKTDLSQTDMDGVQTGTTQALQVTVVLCTAPTPLAKGRCVEALWVWGTWWQ